jgi:hypothetical protein
MMHNRWKWIPVRLQLDLSGFAVLRRDKCRDRPFLRGDKKEMPSARYVAILRERNVVRSNVAKYEK